MLFQDNSLLSVRAHREAVQEMEETEKSEENKIDDYIRIVREALLFYTTAFFVLLLIFR